MNDIYNELEKIKMFDTHTHMDAGHISARGLHDILLYHMVISDLYSAGCPNGARLSEDPSEEEAISRIKQAIPYIKHIQNTSCFWGVRIILKDLYGWEEPITAENFQKLHTLIKNKSDSPDWGKSIIRKAGVLRVCTELWRGRGHLHNDVFQYSLEWAFFARCQWGQFDTALLELENAWGQNEPGAPLPVTIGKRPVLSKTIRTLDDVREAIKHYCDKIPYEKTINTAQHLSTDINYRSVTDDEMAKALKNRDNAGVAERDIYSCYILEQFLKKIENKNLLFLFSFGAEPLVYETGSKLKADSVFQLAAILERHPNVKFQAALASEHQNQSMCTLAREHPNLSLAGYWWHNFFPSSIRKIMNERFDMLAANKQIGFFSDAYCADWLYAKAVIVRKQLAEVLTGKIKQGQYTSGQALDTAKQILFDSPVSLAGMKV